MRKLIPNLIAVVLTFTSGISIHNALSAFEHPQLQKPISASGNNDSGLVWNDQPAPAAFHLTPCSEFKDSGRYWYGKAVGEAYGGVLNQRILCGVMPDYPQEAKEKGFSGKITVRVKVDESGRVVSANSRDGHYLLRRAAIRAVFQTRFSPGILGGESVRLRGVIIYHFVLSESPAPIAIPVQ